MESPSEEDTLNNKYIILEKKGRGATANVYLVEDKNDKKQYAAKVLKEVSPLFEKEIEILQKVSNLNCPFIVKLFEYGEGPIKFLSKPKKNRKYAILEYASKGELFNYIFYPKKGLNEKHAKLYFHKILKGVQAFHNAGICHRDIKMQNILVDDKFEPKICDFGYAAEIKGKDGSGKLDEFFGTKNYCAPEILLNRKYDGIKIDIFSLGVVLLNLVTCSFGFHEATVNDKYYRNIMSKKYDAYWNLVSNQIGVISEELKNLYIKMISYSPKLRPSIDDILNDPWMKEVTSLDDKDYSLLEKEVYEDFKKREVDVLNNNETIETESSCSNEISFGNDRGATDNEVEYFDLSLTPKYIKKTGLNMNNYIKINGNLRPCEFMNSLANKIMNNFEDNVKIEESKTGLKFNVIFEETLEDEEEPDEELKKELDKLSLENIDELEEVIAHRDCVIQIKLFKTLNGGYLVRFVRKDGEIEEYHKNLESIISIIKKIL